MTYRILAGAFALVFVVLIAAQAGIVGVKEKTDGGWAVRLDTGTVLHVPNEPANRHFQEVQAWIADGNTPAPPDVVTRPTERQRAETALKNSPAFRALVRRELATRRAAGEPALTVQDIINEFKAALP